ncbi:MAG: endonuclease III [Halobacteriota archaeon]|nr:endonuclease III [Halobacteriota archaeon]
MKMDIDAIVELLDEEHRSKKSAITEVSERSRDPFHVLISCLLSLRTKDEVTIVASKRLFALAETPEDMSRLGTEEIERAIYPVGFYKTKAERIKQICLDLIESYDSEVPDTIDELMKLKGVGRKTANIVVTMGFGKLGIAVDTHVHRISNRLGLVSTKRPVETEFELRKKLPKKYWIIFNDLLVLHGKSICTPISPKCSICPLPEYCNRVGVEKSR